jgi:hypothetical protein
MSETGQGKAFPVVPEMLARVRAAGLKRHARYRSRRRTGIAGRFDALLSVEEVGAFKVASGISARCQTAMADLDKRMS